MKFLFSLLFSLCVYTNTLAAVGVATPFVNPITETTVGGFTVTAGAGVSGYTGNRTWSLVITPTTGAPIEIRDIPAINPLTREPAPKNCTERRDSDCVFVIRDYKVTHPRIVCDSSYRVIFTVTSLDEPGVSAQSRPVTFRTPSCSAVGTFGVTVGDFVPQNKSTLIFDLRANVAGLSGPQTVEFFIGIEEGDVQDTTLGPNGVQGNKIQAPYQSIGTKTGTSLISLQGPIGNLDCNKKYIYQGKIKIGNQERFTPVYRTGDLFVCETSIGGSGGGGSAGSQSEVEGNNVYTFLTPLPVGEKLQDQSSVVIGANTEGGVFGILQRIFTIMLVAAVILAVVFMIIGGARYATGDKLSGKMGGREMITNAITGLLFALLSWLLLNIVNPDLLRFTLSLPNIGGKLTTTTTSPTSGGGTDSSGTAGTCASCVPITNINTNSATCCKAYTSGVCPAADRLSGEQCKVNAALFDKLKILDSTLTEGTLTITEAWPPTVVHSNICHKTGRCVDARSNESGTVKTNSQFLDFLKAAKAANLLIQYEVPNQSDVARLNALVPADLKNVCARGNCVIQLNVSPHFSVYLSGGGSGSTNANRLIKFENIGVGDKGVWGKASGKPITESEAKALANKAKTSSWYGELTRVARVDAKTLASIIMIESSGDPTKEWSEPDGRKSCGLGQILTETAKGLDPSLNNKSVTEICTKLKEPNYNIKLSYQYYRSLTGDLKKKVAAYNGGPGNQGATGASQDCPGLMRFECPWEETGCYDVSKPNDEPQNTSCTVNTGYEVTRFYVDKVKKISDQL